MEQKKAPLLNPLMIWFLLAMILANIAGLMYQLFIPIYLTELGASVGQVGLVFTYTSVVVLALQVLGGWISDAIGRLQAIAIGSIGGVLGYLAMLLAPSWQWMLLAMTINQIPYALVGPSFSAFIAENSAPENRGRMYGITDTIYQIVGVIGPPLGGMLAQAYGFRWMLLVAAIFYSMAAVLRIWMARTMRSGSEREKKPLTATSFVSSAKKIAALLLGGGLITWIFLTDGVRDVAFRLSNELQPLYLEKIAGMSLAEIGVLGSIFSIAMMVTPMLSGRLGDRHGERVPIAAGFLVMFSAYMVFLQSQGFLGFALTWVLFGLGVGLMSPAYQSLISKAVPHESLGTFSGLFYGSMGLVALPAPYLGAWIWERFNPRVPFMITALVVLLSVIPIWSKFKLEKTEPVESGAVG